MKNRKSVGKDGLNAEYVKYGPPEIHNGIAILLNTIAKTGKYTAEIKSGIRAPLPKPGKKQGPPANLRPIILLLIIRKILAICLIRRYWDRLIHGKIMVSSETLKQKTISKLIRNMQMILVGQPQPNKGYNISKRQHHQLSQNAIWL